MLMANSSESTRGDFKHKSSTKAAAAETQSGGALYSRRHCGLGLPCGLDFLPEQAEAEAEQASPTRQNPSREQQQNCVLD